MENKALDWVLPDTTNEISEVKRFVMATKLKLCIFPSVFSDLFLGFAAPFTVLCRAHSFVLGQQAKQGMGGRDVRQLLQVVVLQRWPMAMEFTSLLCIALLYFFKFASIVFPRGEKPNIQIILSTSCIFPRKNNLQHHLIFLQ